MSAVDRSVNCYFCGGEFDERDCINADDFNGGDGGSICPECLVQRQEKQYRIYGSLKDKPYVSVHIVDATSRQDAIAQAEKMGLIHPIGVVEK